MNAVRAGIDGPHAADVDVRRTPERIAGALLRAIGTRGVGGADAAHFDLHTDVLVSRDGSFFVADRENGRLPLFSSDGQYLTQWRPEGTTVPVGESHHMRWRSTETP